MKKITFLALHLGYGGAERSVISRANLLSEFCSVEIISFYKLLDQPAFKVDPRVKITYLTENLKPNRDELKTALKRKNFALLIKEGLKSVKILYLRRALMKKAIKGLRTDIAVSTRYLYHKLLTRNAPKNTVCIAEEHNHHNGNQKYIIKQLRAIKDMAYFLPVSKELTKFYADKVKKGVKCVYIPHYLDFFPEETADLTQKNLTAVGRLSAEKGFDDLIEVFKIVCQKHSDWKLHIVGDGDCRENIENLIKQHHLEQNVIMHGFKNRDEINLLLKETSVYVMTSHTESFGLVLIEAQSFGIPCVAFDSAKGACEVLNGGNSGILVKNRDKVKMAKVINELIENPEKRQKLGEISRKVSKNYSYENIRQQWFDFINNI